MYTETNSYFATNKKKILIVRDDCSFAMPWAILLYFFWLYTVAVYLNVIYWLYTVAVYLNVIYFGCTL